MPLGTVTKISIGWALAVAAGLYSFVLSKRYIDSRRYESMKVRERMRNSNIGDYPKSSRQFSE